MQNPNGLAKIIPKSSPQSILKCLTMNNRPLNAVTFSHRIQSIRNRLKKPGNKISRRSEPKKKKRKLKQHKNKTNYFSNCKAIRKYKNLEEFQMQSVTKHTKKRMDSTEILSEREEIKERVRNREENFWDWKRMIIFSFDFFCPLMFSLTKFSFSEISLTILFIRTVVSVKLHFSFFQFA